MIQCKFYKEDDYGYLHSEVYLPFQLIPSVGEIINLWYPDGGVFWQAQIISFEKFFGEDELHYEFICSILTD